MAELLTLSLFTYIYICVFIHTHIYMCVYTHTHTTYTMKYYSAINNEILPFEIIWMDLEGIHLTKIRQGKTKRNPI